MANIFYQIAAMLDVFRAQLTLQDIMTMELPLLSELYNGRVRFLEEKRKIEKEEMDKIRNQRQSAPSRRRIR